MKTSTKLIAILYQW